MKKILFDLKPHRLYLAFLLCLLSFSAHTKVYKWTDENGKVHYSDKPIDEKSQQIKMKHGPTDAEILRAKQRASSLIQHQNKVQEIANEEARDKLITEEKKEKAHVNTMQACKEAKRLILAYSSGRPIYTRGKDGKKTYKGYTDDQKNQMIAQLQKSIKENCND